MERVFVGSYLKPETAHDTSPLFRATEALGLGPTDHGPSTKRRLDISRREKSKSQPALAQNPTAPAPLLLGRDHFAAAAFEISGWSKRAKAAAMSLRVLNPNAEVLNKSAALHMNINAAKGLQDVLKTNLGPKGTIKM